MQLKKPTEKVKPRYSLFKKVGWTLFGTLCVFAFIIKLADPAFLAFLATSLFVASFTNKY